MPIEKSGSSDVVRPLKLLGKCHDCVEQTIARGLKVGCIAARLAESIDELNGQSTEWLRKYDARGQNAAQTVLARMMGQAIASKINPGIKSKTYDLVEAGMEHCPGAVYDRGLTSSVASSISFNPAGVVVTTKGDDRIIGATYIDGMNSPAAIIVDEGNLLRFSSGEHDAAVVVALAPSKGNAHDEYKAAAHLYNLVDAVAYAAKED